MSTIETFSAKTRPKTPSKLSRGDWLDFEEPQVILYAGMRGSGKGVVNEATAERLYNQGVTVLHIWGARSFENLYWAINKDCGLHYSKMKQLIKNKCIKDVTKRASRLFPNEEEFYLKLLEREDFIKMSSDGKIILTRKGYELVTEQLTHCKCGKAYPIVWIVPDYFEVNQESLDRFNGAYWCDLDEYKEHLIEIWSEEKQLLLEGKLLKPIDLRPKPLIKVVQITTPTSTHRKEVFRKEFTKIVLDAREERRIVVMNPITFEGQMDKFDTLTEIFRMILFLFFTYNLMIV